MDLKENNNGTGSEVEMRTQDEQQQAAAAANGEAEAREEGQESEAKGEEEQQAEAKGEEEQQAEAGKNNGNDQGDGNLSAPRPSIEGASPGKIFVGGLPKETADDEFKNHFEKYGKVVDSVIMKHRGTGHPRGFGFITFENPAVVDAVIVDEHIFGSKTVEIKRTIPKGAISGRDFPTKKIFVGGIPTSVNEDEFKNFFAKFGDIEEHQIMRDHASGRSRGFGFIAFSTEKAVDDLLTKGNRIEFAGAQVEIKKAEPKKPGNASHPPSSAKNYSNPRPAYGRGYKDHYGGTAPGGIESGPYRYGGGYGSRPRGYAGYSGSEFDGVFAGYGSTAIGSYRGESSLAFTSRYGGMGRGYGVGGWEAPTDNYGRYNTATGYGGGYDSVPGVSGYGDVGYGANSAGGMYGGRRDYGGGSSGRYHPYSR